MLIHKKKKKKQHTHRHGEGEPSPSPPAVVEAQEDDRQPDDGFSDISDGGTLSDETMEGEGTPSSGGESGYNISSAEMSRIIEESQMKVVKLLLKEQDKRYEKIEKGQRKLMAELKKDTLQTVDSKIDWRMSQAMKEVKGMVDEANKAAAEAKAAAIKAASGGAQMPGLRTPSSYGVM